MGSQELKLDLLVMQAHVYAALIFWTNKKANKQYLIQSCNKEIKKLGL